MIYATTKRYALFAALLIAVLSAAAFANSPRPPTRLLTNGDTLEVGASDKGGVPWLLERTTGRAIGDSDGRVLRFKVQFGEQGAGNARIKKRLPIKTRFPFRVMFEIRMNEWTSIEYVSVGWRYRKRLWSVRVPHVFQSEWHRVVVDPESLAFAFYNSFEEPPDHRLDQLEIHVSGTPSSSGATIDLRSVKVASQPSGNPDLAVIGAGENGFAAWWRKYSGPEFSILESTIGLSRVAAGGEAAKRYMEDNVIMLEGFPPMSSEELSTALEPLPTNRTFRYRWHSLALAETLFQAYALEPSVRLWETARDFTEGWLEENLRGKPRDPRYVYYDHGVGERAVALAKLWALAHQNRARAETARWIVKALARHAQLLASDAFYVRNQRQPFHNHAVFQDMGLLAVCATVPEIRGCRKWRPKARRRLARQFFELVTDRGMSVENSFGYHVGLASLCERSAVWLEDLAEPYAKSLRLTCRSMREFERFLRYPDGAAPATGDTWRSGEGATGIEPSGVEEAHVYQVEGVARVKGANDGRPWQVNLWSTNVTDTHKHEDHLSLTVWSDGHEWLVDPGFYAYAPVRHAEYAKHVSAHNVLGFPEFAYDTSPGHSKLRRRRVPGGFWVEGEHDAQAGTRIKRHVYGKWKNPVIFVRDEFQGASVADARLWFQLAPETASRRLGSKESWEAWRLSVDPGEEVDLIIHDADGCEALRGQEKPRIAGWVYPGLKRKVPATTIECGPADRVIRWQVVLHGKNDPEDLRRMAISQEAAVGVY